MSWRRPLRLLARRAVRRIGYDLAEYPGLAFRRRMKLWDHFGVDLVLDVGADTGEYVQTIRRHGYAGRVVSFEPLSSAFAPLCENAAGDARWETVNVALGEREGRATIHIAGNSHSSSLRPMLGAHLEAAPRSAFIGSEDVDVRRLDTIFDEHRRGARHVFLKVDTQGWEREVLAGGERALEQIVGLQLEMSLVPLYGGQALFADLLEWVTRRGFTLMSLEPGFADERTGQLLQVDGVFFRAAPRAKKPRASPEIAECLG
jgi:FkbM family methyltransferase